MAAGFWRFALLAWAAAVGAAAVLIAAIGSLSGEHLAAVSATRTSDLASLLADVARPAAEILLAPTPASTPASPSSDTVKAQLGEALSVRLAELKISEVAIYDPDGRAIFATRGDAAADTDLLWTHVPLHDDFGSWIGTVAVATDNRIAQDRIVVLRGQIAAAVIGILASLYLLMLLLFRANARRAAPAEPERRAADPPAGQDVALPAPVDALPIPIDDDFYDAMHAPQLASRIKSEFIATISHEIRTPMNAVIGMADLLKLTNLTRKQRSYIQNIQSGGDMLLSLVDNILDYSKLEAGALIIQNQEFDIVDLIERVLEIMGYPAASKGLELIATMHHDLFLRVSADKQRLQQILVNVVSNAVKFTDDGEITIDVTVVEHDSERQKLHFSVRDTGSGIDPATRQDLFTPFASGVRSASRKHNGSGLGLAICKRLIDSMGGEIEVRSTLGCGTEVSFAVPVERRRALVGEQIPISGIAHPLRVLVAHANSAAGASLCTYLQSWGVYCEETSSPEETISRLRRAATAGRPFDKLIVDANLTPLDRLLLARRIRGLTETTELPIVLLTSIAAPLEIGEVSSIGGVRCVNKPVLPLELRYNLVRVELSEEYEPESEAEPPEPDNALQILVAEDNVVNSTLLLGMLRAEGFAADVAADAQAVLDALDNKRYDLVLMDGQMPGMEGPAIAEIIRSYPSDFPHQPIIVAVTAEATEQYRQQCLAAGMDDFIAKPLRLDRLRAGLVKWRAMARQRGGSVTDGDEPTCVRKRLMERTGQVDDSFLANYIGLFLLDTDKRLARLSAAVAEADEEIMKRECHALKGACLEFGADRMVRYCEALSAAPLGEDASIALCRLCREFTRLRPVFESVTNRVH